MAATHPLWRPFAPQANTDRQAQRVAYRQTPPGPLQDHDSGWVRSYQSVRSLIESALHDQTLRIHHVGSTAVPGLVAKPIIDIDLTVPDCEDESAYLPQLEAVGFRLIFRDAMGGDPHRQLTLTQPNTNLHVWSPAAVEPRRHLVFIDWLINHPDDLDWYAKVKSAAAHDDRNYNDGKAPLVYDIYERIFADDPVHQHDPQPRT